MSETILRYQYQPSDFPQVYRLLRRTTNLAMLITTAHLLLAMLPSLLLLVIGGDHFFAALFVGAAVTGLVAGRWISRRRMRRQFNAHCIPREARIGDDYFQVQWELGWMRCGWSWLSEVAEDRGWIVLRRGRRRLLAALLPPSAVAPSQRATVLEELARRVAQDGPAMPLRDGEGEVVQEVDFRLTPDEMAQVAERVFLPRRRSWLPAWLLVLAGLLVVLVVPMTVGPSPEHDGLIRIMLAAVLILIGLTVLAPVKRRLFGALLGDESLLLPQHAALRQSGIELRMANMQSLARWPQVAGLIDSRRFLAVITSHGGLLCIPRRALPNGLDDRFLQQAGEQIRQHAERQLPLREARPVDTGNPYQPPTE